MPGLFRSVALLALVGLPAVCMGAEPGQERSKRGGAEPPSTSPGVVHISATPAKARAGSASPGSASPGSANPGGANPGGANPGGASRPSPTPVLLTASLSSGWIEGVVTDDRSHPIGGAAVTAQGRDFLLVETDGTGRFSIRSVPAGTYLLRVQGRGFTASRREFVQVLAARGTRHDVRLRRAADVEPVPGEARVIAAGMALSQITAGPTALEPVSTTDDTPIEGENHDHSSAAWRLRHLKRSVLRDSTMGYGYGGDPGLDELWTDVTKFDLRDWTADVGRSTVSLLARNGFTGRVQFLTSSAFDQPFQAFADQEMPSGIAYINLGSPVSTRTSWSVEAAAAQGAVSSWFLGGTYATVIAGSHGVDVRSSYSRQRYEGGNAAALAAFTDGSRNVGGVQVMDRWTLNSRALVTYGGRYEHYDYLQHRGLFSPTLTLSVSPAERTWIRATVAQQMTAPGAEEFVPQAYGSLALPPQRTFAPLVPGAAFGRERTRHVGLALERDVASFLLGVRAFRQHVDDQLVTVFGLEQPDGSARPDLSHYSAANGGNFSAMGWGVSISRPMGSRIRGSIEYSVSRAEWTSVGDANTLGRWAPSAIRAMDERLHDLTTHLDTEIHETATRVLATYKLNSGYTRDELVDIVPGAETRFDVQVYQGLPFLGFTKANWELVFAVRNLFRESRDGAVSVYDELLVVRPPKRVVGGVTVQF
jgi:hypothetical protein